MNSCFAFSNNIKCKKAWKHSLELMLRWLCSMPFLTETL